MNFENPFLFNAVVIGPFFILVGAILLKYPPKRINSFYGYRTKKSMTNQTFWDLSQKYSGKIMILSGLIYSIILGILSNFKIAEKTAIALSLLLIFIMCVGIYYFTEKKLKN